MGLEKIKKTPYPNKIPINAKKKFDDIKDLIKNTKEKLKDEVLLGNKNIDE